MSKHKFLTFLISISVSQALLAETPDKCYDNAYQLPIIAQSKKGESGNDPNIINVKKCTAVKNKYRFPNPQVTLKHGEGVSSCPDGYKEIVYEIRRTERQPLSNGKSVTQSTVSEIDAMMKSGEIFAVGFHQFNPPTFSCFGGGSGCVMDVLRRQYPEKINEPFSADLQNWLYGHYWFKNESRGKRIWKWLTCGEGEPSSVGTALSQIWAFPTPGKNGSNNCKSYYEGNGHDRAYNGVCWSDVENLLRQSKNQLIDSGCASCEKEEVKENEPNNPPPGKEAKPAKKLREYTPTAREDIKYKSKARKPTASYKRNASPQCYCNKS